jgi:glutamate synthase (NADPH/NADH) small chain
MRGRVIVDPATGRTGNPKVWSGGDCVNGGKEVVNAVAEAKVAVTSMHAFLMGA